MAQVVAPRERPAFAGRRRSTGPGFGEPAFAAARDIRHERRGEHDNRAGYRNVDFPLYLRGLSDEERRLPDVEDDLPPRDVELRLDTRRMTLRYMLDTNVLSSIVREPFGSAARRVERAGTDTVCCSVVVAAELRFGVAKIGPTPLERTVDELLLRMTVLPLEETVDRFYADLRAVLGLEGREIGSNDLRIAAHAPERRLSLVTGNTREFERAPGLHVVDWLEAERSKTCNRRFHGAGGDPRRRAALHRR